MSGFDNFEIIVRPEGKGPNIIGLGLRTQPDGTYKIHRLSGRPVVKETKPTVAKVLRTLANVQMLGIISAL